MILTIILIWFLVGIMTFWWSLEDCADEWNQLMEYPKVFDLGLGFPFAQILMYFCVVVVGPFWLPSLIWIEIQMQYRMWKARRIIRKYYPDGLPQPPQQKVNQEKP